jgi:hypothetical protein
MRQGFCGACHAFTGRCSLPGCGATPARIAGNVALCAAHGDEIGVT